MSNTRNLADLLTVEGEVDVSKTTGIETLITSETGIISRSKRVIDADFILGSNENGTTAGPVTIADTVTVTITSPSIWSVV